ncbi:Ni/Fe hydrogenase subunit alpha [candidate division WOR-3 bacterium]|nr:Ni/Fe hydrogenase subunit alpha [candidate division WOR-3 bacterium]
MKKIKIDLISRVEGHGGILVKIDNNKVEDVRVNIYEGPRLIEQLLIGKDYSECLNIVPRICAICTLSHRYASIRALEKVLNISVKKKVSLMRFLMHLGEIMESNSLHVFVLALPDFFGYPSITEMLQDYKDIVISGLKIKQFANLIMRKTSARMIHGENPIVGGFGKYPTNKELNEIKRKATELIPVAVKALDFLSSVKVPNFCEEKEKITFMCLNSGEEFGFVGDTVLISTGEERSVDEYEKLTNERVVSHSYAKRCSYKNKTFTVGAIARVNLLGERLKGESYNYFKKMYNVRWKKNPLYNNHAQLLEILFVLEKIPSIIDEIKRLKDPAIEIPEKASGEATGAVEAPRGTLYHYYNIENGLIKKADIITPTEQNLDEMERFLRITAENLLKKSKKELKPELEMVARAYDPCISCSAHLVKVIPETSS